MILRIKDCYLGLVLDGRPFVFCMQGPVFGPWHGEEQGMVGIEGVKLRENPKTRPPEMNHLLGHWLECVV